MTSQIGAHFPCGRVRFEEAVLTIEQAEAEYTRLLNKKSTQEELLAGYMALVRAMDKLRMERNNISDNDEKEGDMWP